jgi:hypothetical protein
MFYNDHGPAHFHALYAEFQATIDIERLAVLEGIFRGEPWNWCSTGPNSIKLNCSKTGTLRGKDARRTRFRRWSRLD